MTALDELRALTGLDVVNVDRGDRPGPAEFVVTMAETYVELEPCPGATKGGKFFRPSHVEGLRHDHDNPGHAWIVRRGRLSNTQARRRQHVDVWIDALGGSRTPFTNAECNTLVRLLHRAAREVEVKDQEMSIA